MNSYRANAITEPSCFDLPYVCLVLDGCYMETTPEGDFKRDAGTVHFHSKAELQSGVIGGDGARCLSIVAMPPRIAEYGHVDWGRQLSPNHLKTVDPIVRRIAKTFDEEKALTNGSSLQSLGLELFSRLSKFPRRHREPDWIDTVTSELAAGPDAPTLLHLSRITGVHPSHIVKGLKKWRGYTPMEYYRQLKIERALDMLLTTDWKIGRVAAEAGYCDESHFNKWFKQAKGASPAAYRREHKG